MKILDDFTTPVNQTMLGKKVVGFQWFPIKINQLLAVFFCVCVCDFGQIEVGFNGLTTHQ